MAGRPSKYFTHVEPKLLLVQSWARDGLTLDQIAHNLGVALSSFCEYKNKYPELSEALKNGKEVIDVQVENALLKRALGYDYEEVTKEPLYHPISGDPILDEQGNPKIAVTKVVQKMVNPDTTAQIFWLKNRRPTQWRDRHEMDVKGEVVNRHEYHIEQTIQTDPESAELLKQLYKRSLVASVGDSSQA